MSSISGRLWFRQLTFFVFVIACQSLLTNKVQGQQTRLTLKIINEKREAVPFASLTISPLEDSLRALHRVTDSNGTATADIKYGQYTLSGSSVNYLPFKKNISVKSSNPVLTIMVSAVSTSLKGVVVTALRPVIRQEDDKTIVDPENLAASSTNVYEILEKIPGLFVDQDGNIYLSSTTPAKIYINGREQKLSTSDIATMLKNLPPNAIASVEILRTPSAKYDASGSGGIINVVLRKGVKIGLTGSFTLGGNQGKYGNRFAGLTINNNNGKVSSYINIQYGRRNTFEQTRTNRLFGADSLLSQDARSLYPTNSYYAGFGINWEVGKRWEVGYDGKLNYSNFINTTDNFSLIKKVSSDDPVTYNNSDVRNKGYNFSLSQGASAKYKIDSAGSEWNIDVSYNYLPDVSNQSFTNTFYIPANYISGGEGRIEGRLNFSSLQTNLLLKLPEKITLEAGLKSSLSNFSNTTDYFHRNGGSLIKDEGRTSAYTYRENINAAYLQASKNIYGITVKAGARVENTVMEGNQLIPVDTSFSLRRTDLFPYIYVSKNLFNIMSYSLKAYLVYRRTISRPGYQMLNPSQRFVDQYLFETGNPFLRPQFTQNYEANISVDERPVLALGINDTKDIFTNVIYQADSSHSIAYRTYDNLGSNKEIYFRALGAIPPGKKYFIVAGLQYNRNLYRGFYEEKPLLFKRGSWSFFTYQTLRLTSTTQLTLNGFARFNGQLQFYELGSFGSLNFSVSQQLMRRKLVITASLNDIFLTNRNDFTLQQGSVNASGFRRADTRRAGLNLRYNFGLRKKENNNILDELSPERNN